MFHIAAIDFLLRVEIKRHELGSYAARVDIQLMWADGLLKSKYFEICMCKRVYQLLHISKMACTINLYWIRFVKRYKMDTPIFYRSWFAFNLRLWKWILHFCRRRNTYLHLSRDCVLYLINLLTQFHIITNIYINIIIEQYLIYPFSRALFWCINNKLWLIFFSEFNICVTFTLSLDFKIKDVCVIVIWQYYYVPPIAPNLNIKNYILL